ncbi:MAG TPA: YciI family protein [bacterium]|nr:YciI family protein [bacterium]
MSRFLLLLYQAPTRDGELSPEDIQRIIAKYTAWRDGLVQRNKMRGGEKLTDDGGRLVRVQSGTVTVTDGPYSEVHEVLGGFFVIDALDYNDAVEIARTCPHLAEGQRIEVREVDAMNC